MTKNLNSYSWMGQEIASSVILALLKDHTTQKKLRVPQNSIKNIRWACDEYAERGDEYHSPKEISLSQLDVIKPRTEKSKEEQKSRTRESAEVFTPSWICNEMINHCDEVWFGRKNAFNTQDGQTWTSTTGPIRFTSKKTWTSYVKSRRLEITCGEAPYLVSRYDTTTGETLDISNRIGILDRKLRIVGEHTSSPKEWIRWAKHAYKNTYGFEYKGDSLFLARLNLLITFIENYQAKFGTPPSDKQQREIATIIAWNIWQMDGLTNSVPCQEQPLYKMQSLPGLTPNKPQPTQLTFAGISPSLINPKKNKPETSKIYCNIKNWRSRKIISYTTEGDIAMKFDFCIGNPPYQETRENTSDKQVYNDFMDASYKIAQKVELITPARFLFNSGRTPKEWNEQILNDEHFKVIRYEPNSKQIFSNTDIKGGIVISYRDSNKVFGKIEVFTAFNELNSILDKLRKIKYTSLNTIMYPYSTYSLSSNLFLDFPELKNKLSNEKIITTNIFDLLPNLFFEKKPDDNQQYICLLGRRNNERQYKYINARYINVAENYIKYKVIIPKSNGCGALGEVLSTPLIGTPLIGYTQTFLGIGSLDSEYEANALLKYVSSKFARVILGILKSTQHNPPEKWKYVPVQDFTSKSDIDWSQSIAEIDKQLYKKYNLSESEIAFIETHVKEME